VKFECSTVQIYSTLFITGVMQKSLIYGMCLCQIC